MENENLKLIYVHKVGYSSKGYNTFEFIFSEDPSNIDYEKWGWDKNPASDNAEIPSKDYYNKIYTVNIEDFNLYCLHEAYDREYMHGYHTIHALAYEIENEDDLSSYDKLFGSEEEEEPPLLVFHYGTDFKEIKELFYSRNVIMKEL